MKILVTCKNCGKQEYVCESRAKKYVCCSRKCMGEYNAKKYSQQIKCICPICNSEFYLKPSKFQKNKTHCCSVECAAKLKETIFCGENNHQFGLKGPLNASFINAELQKKNVHQTDIYVYDPTCPDANTSGRVKKHRYLVYQNKNKFDKNIFDFSGKLKKVIQVHHIDCKHDNNIITNLIPLTLKQHTKIHNLLGNISSELISSIIGVVKQGELLENPEVDNQQPSLYGNIFEGSETNSRIQLDSNADTSALLQQVISLLNDYIVQTRKITKDAYDASIKEILESEIKSSEVTQ